MHKVINIEQVKAARALLNWNQERLAKAANLSKPAIANLERGKVTPRGNTINAITKALELAGVEFTEGPGVRLRGQTLRINIFEGTDSIFRLWQDSLETLKQTGGERLISGVDERVFDTLAGKERFRGVLQEFYRHKITTRILSREGDTYFVEPVSHYRWVPDNLFAQVPYYIYADKYAIFLTDPIPRIVLIENKAIADSYRKQFNAIWDDAKIPVVK